MRLRHPLLLAVLVVLAAPAGASAAPCTSLEAQVSSAASGATINVAGVKTGCHITYSGKSLTFQGVTTDAGFDGGDGTNSIVTALGPGTSVFRDLTFRNAVTPTQSGAAVRLTNDASGALIRTRFFANQSATSSGGAVSASGSTGSLLVQDSTFGSDLPGQGNSAPAFSGGAIYTVLNAGAVTIERSTFTGNSARDGGGVALNGPSVTLTADTFARNQTTANNGGASISTGGDAIVRDSKFIGNRVDSPVASSSGRTSGGLNLIARDHIVNQTGNLFQDNVITYNRPSDDGSPSGGGGELVNGRLVSRGDRFIHNTVRNTAAAGPPPEGGGLFVFGCLNVLNPPHTPARAANLVAAGNVLSAGGEGAGVYGGCTPNPVDFTLEDSTIAGNSGGSPLDGGALDTLTLINSVVSAGGTAPSITGFASRAVAFSDACLTAGHAFSGAGNRCADPRLKNPGAGDIHETSRSPTRDRGSNSRVPAGLTTDFEGGRRITDAQPDGKAIVDMGADETLTGALVVRGLHVGKLRLTGRHRGTRITYSITGPAKVTYTFTRLLSHHRTRRAGAFAKNVRAGRQRQRFSGRVGHHTLAPGKYKLIVTAKNKLNNRSRRATTTFTVVR